MYRLDDVALTIEPADLAARSGLHRVCASFASAAPPGPSPCGTCVALRVHPHGASVPDAAVLRCNTEGFRIFDGEGATYVSDGVSTLHIRHGRRRGDAYLDNSFYAHSPSLQWHFWSFAVLTLLRPSGYFALHAAGVASPAGTGTLIVGPSGSAKSTLAIGLIRAGWSYLSDEAVLLARRGPAIAARPLRRQFYVDAADAAAYADLRLGADTADAAGGLRREVYVDERFGRRRLDALLPRVLLFPTIAGTARSEIVELDSVSALRRLLTASGPQLLGSTDAAAHLEMLRALDRQCAVFHLRAGRDLRVNPAALAALLPQLEPA